MMNMNKRRFPVFPTIFMVTVFAGLQAVSVFAGPNENALAANNRGDFPTTLLLWRTLADQGYASAQDNIGLMYYNGQGVTQDYGQAVALCLKAANQGFAHAQYDLGVLYHNGQGVPRNYRRNICG